MERQSQSPNQDHQPENTKHGRKSLAKRAIAWIGFEPLEHRPIGHGGAMGTFKPGENRARYVTSDFPTGMYFPETLREGERLSDPSLMPITSLNEYVAAVRDGANQDEPFEEDDAPIPDWLPLTGPAAAERRHND